MRFIIRQIGLQEEIKCLFITKTNHDIIEFVSLCLVNSHFNTSIIVAYQHIYALMELHYIFLKIAEAFDFYVFDVHFQNVF